MKRGDVWTAAGGGDYLGKPRPIVVVQDDGFDATASITICAFTTDPSDAPLFRVAVDPSESNGLRSPCRMMVDKITTIPYGADRLLGLPEAPVRAMGLEPQRYVTLIARAEPENSVLEMVQGFSRRRRGVVLVVLGAYRDDLPYHCAVRAAASDEVRFLGPLFDQDKVQALRFHSALYFHGHQVGGTNPSLVEALGAGNAIVAHDNRFNRWVAGDAARYFMDADEFARVLDELLVDEAAMASLRAAAVIRHAAAFTWAAVLKDYEALLEDWQPGSS